MSRSAAATTAGRTRTVQRSVPPAPRRVSGPAAPPRRDDGRPSRPPRPPRARIDARALVYADGAVVERYGARALAYADGAVVERYGARALAYADGAVVERYAARALAYADGAVVERYGALPVRRARTVAAPRPPRLAYGGVAIASRMAGVALDVSASRFMDRVVRGRVWIGVIALGLIGLVAMQVSLLKLNSGIGRAVQTISTLERSNSALRSDITRLSAGERIQPLAESQGFVMPAPADVDYLRGGDRHDVAVRAARRMRAPDPAAAGFAGSATAPGPDVAATTAIAPTGAPATATPAGATPATGAATGAPATGAPATGAPATSATSATPPIAPATTAPTPAPAAPATGAAVPTSTPAPATTAPGPRQPVAAADPGSGGATPQQATAQTP